MMLSLIRELMPARCELCSHRIWWWQLVGWLTPPDFAEPFKRPVHFRCLFPGWKEPHR